MRIADCFTQERLNRAPSNQPPANQRAPDQQEPDQQPANQHAPDQPLHADPRTRRHLLARAEAILAEPWPVLTATGYARYDRDGDRSAFQRPYFDRRARLLAAVLSTILDKPAVDDINDGAWLMCEETTWCVPAHDLVVRRGQDPLPDPGRPYLDLFAAETAALLAHTDLLAGDLMEPAVRRRARQEVIRRVLGPYRDSDEWWWLGLGGKRNRPLNNWTTWIHANVLAASLILEDPADFRVTAARAVAALDRYLGSVPEDGGCDEGISYWWHAGGALLECLETLSTACGGDFGVFGIQKIRNIARYPLVAHIADDWHVNFADGSAKVHATVPHLLYRFGRRTGDDEVVRHARALRGTGPALRLVPSPNGSLGRLLAGLRDAGWAAEPEREFPLPAQSWLPVTGVLTARERAGTADGLFLAAKGGHNDESHNHNDVGTFVVALDGRPLLIDAGVGEYTKKTFGPDRYDIWTMQSSWHNVPEVDGVAQQAGRGHEATNVSVILTPDAAELTLDLAAAYPPAAGIAGWRRTLRLDRTRGMIVIDDTWDINHHPEKVVVHLLTALEPSRVAAGTLLIETEGRSLAIGYPQTFDAGIEERQVDDRRLAASWGKAIYRVTLTAKDPGRRGSARLTIEPA